MVLMNPINVFLKTTRGYPMPNQCTSTLNTTACSIYNLRE